MRKLSLFILAVIAAAGAFSVTMLTDPPRTEASGQPSGLDISALVVPADLSPAEPADAH